MDANHDKDKLDKFVQDAFDGYEELPSDGMWDRIEAGLPPQGWSWTRKRWSIAASLAILLLASGLIGQHLYYKGKIQELSAQPTEKGKKGEAAPSITVAPSSEPKQILDDANHTNKINKPATDQASILNEEPQPEKKISNTMVSKDSPGLPARGNLPSRVNNNKLPEKGARIPIAQAGSGVPGKGGANGTPAANPSGANTSTAANPLASTTTAPGTSGGPENVLSANGAAAIPEPNVSNNIISKIAALPSGAVLLLAAKEPALPTAMNPVASNPVITPVRNARLWYAGLRVAPGLSTEKIPEPDRPLPPWGGGPRKPEVVNERETTAYTTDWWLRAGRKLGARFSIETGIGYRNIVRTATHKPNFEFRDGHPQPGGPHGGGGSKCFDFDYALETYGGTASVSLRMTQVDSGINVSDKEPIRLEIKTSQRTQVLKVPLLAGVHARMGRFEGQVKAGFVGNFLLKNQLTLEGLNSLNNKFQPEKPSTPKQDFEAPRTFIPGYWASAALEYRLGSHLSAVIEPAVTGDFSTQNQSGRALPRDFSAAVNVGLNYYF